MTKRHIIIMVVAMAMVACSGDKKPESSSDKAEVNEACETNADCADKLICLASKCTDTSSRAIYTNPSGAVTPAKVKKHVEDIGKQAAERTDKALDIN